MKLLASLATALFVTQVALCGVRGFGLGDPVQDAPAAAVASCHGQVPQGTNPDGGDDERRRCRAHCELFERGLSAAVPDVDAPALVTAPPSWALTQAPPGLAHPARSFDVLPPRIPLPILHASLLI